jgi:hypothetical protein
MTTMLMLKSGMDPHMISCDTGGMGMVWIGLCLVWSVMVRHCGATKVTFSSWI